MADPFNDFFGGVLREGQKVITKKFLGGLFGDGPGGYLRDSHHAAYNFNQLGQYVQQNSPRHKFNFLTRFNFNNVEPVKTFVDSYLSRFEQDQIVPLVKRVDMPSFSINSEKLNQYNKWRISQTKINYQPITIVFHDVVDGKTLRLWEMYYEYYFNDGVYINKSSDQLAQFDPPNSIKSGTLNISEFYNDIVSKENIFKGNFGYRLDTQVFEQKQISSKATRYLFDSIEIFQFHGQRYSKAELINPRIIEFKHDTLNYEDSSGIVELTFTIDYEDVVYDNFAREINESEATYFENSSHLESQDIPPKTPFEVRVRRPEYGSVPAFMDGSSIFEGNSVLTNIQKSIGDYITGLPEDIARAVGQSIFTGEVEFPVDPKATARKVLEIAKGETIGTVRRTIEGGISTGIGVITPTVKRVFDSTVEAVKPGQKNSNGQVVDNSRGLPPGQGGGIGL